MKILISFTNRRVTLSYSTCSFPVVEREMKDFFLISEKIHYSREVTAVKFIIPPPPPHSILSKTLQGGLFHLGGG